MPGEDLYSWSVTAANNGNSDSAIEWRAPRISNSTEPPTTGTRFGFFHPEAIEQPSSYVVLLRA